MPMELDSVGERGTPLKGVYPISPDEDERPKNYLLKKVFTFTLNSMN